MMERDVIESLLEWMQSHYFGKYRGVVADNADPHQRGRLKVRVPAVLGANEIWAMPCVPYAGDQVGFFFLPEAGSGVWVEFEGGDPSFPIWTGFFWADGQMPDDGQPARKVLRTRKATLRIDDENDEARLTNTSGALLELADDALLDNAGASLTVGQGGVVSEHAGASLEVANAAVSANGGALEVR
jgi:uncharacterized protein involved in type VI secretion and phage assembly